MEDFTHLLLLAAEAAVAGGPGQEENPQRQPRADRRPDPGHVKALVCGGGGNCEGRWAPLEGPSRRSSPPTPAPPSSASESLWASEGEGLWASAYVLPAVTRPDGLGEGQSGIPCSSFSHPANLPECFRSINTGQGERQTLLLSSLSPPPRQGD